MSRSMLFCLALTLGVSFVGCNATVTSESVEVQSTPAKTNIRVALEDIEKMGNTGSALNDVTSNIEMLQAEDPALAETLKADAAELDSLKDSAKIKAKAKAMLEKLK